MLKMRKKKKTWNEQKVFKMSEKRLILQIVIILVMKRTWKSKLRSVGLGVKLQYLPLTLEISKYI